MKKKLYIPIYGVTVWIVLTKNITVELTKWKSILGAGAEPMGRECAGLCCQSGGGTFALFFEFTELTMEVVAHETFHLTHMILQWQGIDFDVQNSEDGALLHGYLLSAIWKLLQTL